MNQREGNMDYIPYKQSKYFKYASSLEYLLAYQTAKETADAQLELAKNRNLPASALDSLEENCDYLQNICSYFFNDVLNTLQIKILERKEDYLDEKKLIDPYLELLMPDFIKNNPDYSIYDLQENEEFLEIKKKATDNKTLGHDMFTHIFNCSDMLDNIQILEVYIADIESFYYNREIIDNNNQPLTAKISTDDVYRLFVNISEKRAEVNSKAYAKKLTELQDKIASKKRATNHIASFLKETPNLPELTLKTFSEMIKQNKIAIKNFSDEYVNLCAYKESVNSSFSIINDLQILSDIVQDCSKIKLKQSLLNKCFLSSAGVPSDIINFKPDTQNKNIFISQTELIILASLCGDVEILEIISPIAKKLNLNMEISVSDKQSYDNLIVALNDLISNKKQEYLDLKNNNQDLDMDTEQVEQEKSLILESLLSLNNFSIHSPAGKVKINNTNLVFENNEQHSVKEIAENIQHNNSEKLSDDIVSNIAKNLQFDEKDEGIHI